MKILQTIMLSAGIIALPHLAMAQTEVVPLAEEGTPESTRLREAHKSDLEGAMESPAEAASHQRTLDRERGRTTTAPAPAPAPSAPAVPPSQPAPAAEPSAYQEVGNSDLAISSEPDWLKQGGDPNKPPPRAARGTHSAVMPPAAPAAPVSQKSLSVYINTEGTQVVTPPMLFGPWATELSEKNRKTLDAVSAVMTEDATRAPKIRIEAYSDNSGDPAINEALTIARANVVKAYLISSGVGVHRLEAKGYGDSKPIQSNDTPEGRAKNRRIEFKVEK